MSQAYGEYPPRRYRFGPIGRPAGLLGLRSGQLVVMTLGSAMGVFLLRSSGSVTGAALAVTTTLTALVAAFWPVGGRTIEQWAPVVVSYLLGRRSNLWVTPEPLVGLVVTADRLVVPAGRARKSGGHVPLPQMLEGCEVLEPLAPADGRRIGVIADRRRGSYVAVVLAHGSGFSLLEPADRDARVMAWSAALAGLAQPSSPVRRLQWVERSVEEPSPRAGRGPAPTFAGAPALRAAAGSYAELMSRIGQTLRHEVLIAICLDAKRARRALAAAGGGDAAAGLLLARHASLVESELATAGIAVNGALSASALARAVRSCFTGSPGDVQLDGPSGQKVWPWPVATETAWSWLRADQSWHATYWVAEWPRSEVGSAFLGPVMSTRARRSLSVTMEPASPLEAAREVQRSRTDHAADEELRRRSGFVATAQRRGEHEQLQRREAELAEGHAQYRFSAYMTVSASSAEGLQAARAEIEQAAARARLEIRLLHGQQAAAFTWTMPLCRGLR